MNYDRIATLLASGLPAASVSSIVGISPARISQLIKEESFALVLSAKQAEVSAKDVEEISLSAKYTAAEHLLIEQVMQMAPVSELRDVVGALRVVAERQEKAKTRMNPVHQGASTINTVVQLTLPSYVMPALQLNAQKEVIAIDNKALTPMSSKSVTTLFTNMEKEKENVQGRVYEVTEESPREAVSKEATANLIGAASRFLKRMQPISAIEAC